MELNPLQGFAKMSPLFCVADFAYASAPQLHLLRMRVVAHAFMAAFSHSQMHTSTYRQTDIHTHTQADKRTHTGRQTHT